MRLPAFGRKFAERRLAGWDPSTGVVVGVNLWLQRDLSEFPVLVLCDKRPELLDWRCLAGCDVSVIYGEEERELAERAAILIAQCEAESLELVSWDGRQVREVLGAWLAYRLGTAREITGDAELVAYFGRTRIVPNMTAWRFWFYEVDITRICAALDLRRRASLQA